MPRTINTEDGDLEKVLKMIPSEIIGLYLILNSFIPSKDELVPTLIFLVCVGICWVLTPLYMMRLQEVDRKTNSKQITITTVAFIIWVYASGGFDFINLVVEYSYIKGITLALFSFITAKFY